jgi:hypothetical protein
MIDFGADFTIGRDLISSMSEIFHESYDNSGNADCETKEAVAARNPGRQYEDFFSLILSLLFYRNQPMKRY